MYKAKVGQLYDLLLKQKGHVVENKVLDHEEQFI